MMTAERTTRPSQRLKHRRFKRGQQMGRLSISLPPALLTRVQRLGDATGRTYSEIAARLVEDAIAALEEQHTTELAALPPTEIAAD